jgi:hypothetical protein
MRSPAVDARLCLETPRHADSHSTTEESLSLMPRPKAIEQRTKVMTHADPNANADWADAYVRWVAECVSVQEAYERWSTAAAGDASLAFAVYRAALDREEHASTWFAALPT